MVRCHSPAFPCGIRADDFAGGDDFSGSLGDFDAGTEEAAQMTAGLVPSKSAAAPEWDHALEGHSAAERSAADVYTFDV